MENGLKSIAFPLISSGVYGYPIEQAIRVALSTLKEFESADIEIYVVVFDDRFLRRRVRSMRKFSECGR